MIQYKVVKEKCIAERFFPYDDWRDKVFVPPSIFLTWLFVNLRISANIVSLISGLFAIAGGIMLTSENKYIALIGSFGYLGFGIRPPFPEWGSIINDNRMLIYMSPITVIGPAVALSSLVVSLNLFTEGLARLLGAEKREL